MTRDDPPSRDDDRGAGRTRRDLLQRAAGASALTATAATAGCTGLLGGDGPSGADRVDCTDATPTVDGTAGWRVANADPAGTGVAPAGLDLLALDVADGSERWRHTTGLETATAPAVTDDAVYYGDADTNLYALDPATGAVDWRHKTESPFTANVVATPDRVYAATENGRVRSWDAYGVQRFVPQFDATVTHLAADGARVYVATDDHLTALQRESGDVCWRADGYGASYDSGLAVVDDALYAPTETTSGVGLGVYDAATGDRRRVVDPSTDGEPAALEMGPVVVDGAVYATGNAGGLELTKLS